MPNYVIAERILFALGYGLNKETSRKIDRISERENSHFTKDFHAYTESGNIVFCIKANTGLSGKAKLLKLAEKLNQSPAITPDTEPGIKRQISFQEKYEEERENDPEKGRW